MEPAESETRCLEARRRPYHSFIDVKAEVLCKVFRQHLEQMNDFTLAATHPQTGHITSIFVRGKNKRKHSQLG